MHYHSGRSKVHFTALELNIMKTLAGVPSHNCTVIFDAIQSVRSNITDGTLGIAQEFNMLV